MDAFVSHSWSDHGEAKWRALSQWAAQEEKRKAREGAAAGEKEGTSELLLWLDKACIDQRDVDNSLAALPIYLAGCKQLLVLVGHTYISRLWWCALP